MDALFSRDYLLLWALALALMLFYPVRQLIWVLYLRRASRGSAGPLGSLERQRLRKRASLTAALLCFVFSVVYTSHLFATP